MAIVTERQTASPPLVAPDVGTRMPPAVGVLAALPAVALAIWSLLVGSSPSTAEVVRAVLVALSGPARAPRSRPPPPAPARAVVLVRRHRRRLGTLADPFEAHRSLDGASAFVVDLP